MSQIFCENNSLTLLLYVITFGVFFTSCKSDRQSRRYNLCFENNTPNLMPKGWILYWNTQNSGYDVLLDSTIKYEGKYSISITKSAEGGNFGLCSYTILKRYSGNNIKLTGWVKTQNVDKGYAALWMKFNDSDSIINLLDIGQRIKGTNDWQKYSLVMPYDNRSNRSITFGGILKGKGKIWIDDLQIELDGVNIDTATITTNELYKAILDTTFNNGSGILHISLDTKGVRVLTNLGMLWGFLKYYHPSVRRGNWNMDAELFRVLSDIQKVSEPSQAYEIIEKWVDHFGTVPNAQNLSVPRKGVKIKLGAEFGYLFKENNLPITMIKKLIAIRDNNEELIQHYYIGIGKAGNPIFKNEYTYAGIYLPDAGVRLVALFRYWNMIMYFYPNRHLIDKDWNVVLAKFIPKFVNASSSQGYTLSCLELIGLIRDTHSNVGLSSPLVDSLKGKRLTPFQARFVENKLVITGYYCDDREVLNQIRVGDVIERIDSFKVTYLIKKYLPFTPASNYQAQLRILSSSSGFLLRSNRKNIELLIHRGKESKKVLVSTIPLSEANTEIDYAAYPSQVSYKLLSCNVGYIYAAKLDTGSLTEIKRKLGKTKGIILDLRCYPSVVMPFSYGQWLKVANTPFAKISSLNLSKPGEFIYTSFISNGGGDDNCYSGKLVILVNEMTQSQAEYTVMALQTTPNSVVIGSTTAGADGNVSVITFPGGLQTMISGIGVYYPNGTETQQKGVKINIQMEPTIKGIIRGKDEVLEMAIKYIRDGKQNR